MNTTTIVAIATAVGESGIGIVRVSGESSLRIAQAIFQSQQNVAEHIQKLILGKVLDPNSEEIIDQGMVCFFKAPHSYTGEDTIEFHLHGSPVILQKTVELCVGQGALPAAAGEFTKRAFLNGKLDLSQAEAVIETIQAKTEIQRSNATHLLNGALKNKIREIDQKLSDQLIKIEATLDYPEEMEVFSVPNLKSGLLAAHEQVKNLLATADSGRLLREGIRIAIVGKPNVGKSSLFNYLLSEDRSIVTEIAGTTRDVVHEEINWRGMLLRFLDTAGIRESKDRVEQMGIERSRKEIEQAAVILHLIDQPTEAVSEKSNHVVVLNKVDLLSDSQIKKLPSDWVPISVKEGRGFEKFQVALDLKIKNIFPETQKHDFYINARHKAALLKAQEHTELSIESLDNQQPLDMLTIDLRAAVSALREVTGESLSLDVIDQIFKRFCVGK